MIKKLIFKINKNLRKNERKNRALIKSFSIIHKLQDPCIDREYYVPLREYYVPFSEMKHTKRHFAPPLKDHIRALIKSLAMQ